MLNEIQPACTKLNAARKSHEAMKEFAKSVHLTYGHLKQVAAVRSQWPAGMTEEMFSQREAEVSSMDASVVLAGRVMAAAEEAFRSAVDLNVERTLMVRLGADTVGIRDGLKSAITTLGDRLLEFDVLTEIVAELGQSLLP